MKKSHALITALMVSTFAYAGEGMVQLTLTQPLLVQSGEGEITDLGVAMLPDRGMQKGFVKCELYSEYSEDRTFPANSSIELGASEVSCWSWYVTPNPGQVIRSYADLTNDQRYDQLNEDISLDRVNRAFNGSLVIVAEDENAPQVFDGFEEQQGDPEGPVETLPIPSATRH